MKKIVKFIGLILVFALLTYAVAVYAVGLEVAEVSTAIL